MSDRIFFSLGPVQGFVAQARRTRDLWSGSFLLSYLAGCAMNEVLNNNGQILIPDVSDDALLAWINGSREGDAPMIGSLPNRFEAFAPDPKTVARSAAAAIEHKWEKIVDEVWCRFLEDAAKRGRDTESIWRRQVENFWEISWVVGSDISAMNSRKNWRTNMLSNEFGDHCTMMGDWQELSGYIRAKERIKQNEFWKGLQRKIGKLNIKEGERLCALAFIKRLFPKVSEDAIGWEVNADKWPSTPYIAAVPWLKKAIDTAHEDAEIYANEVLDSAPDATRDGISSRIGSFSKMPFDPFLNVDGNFFFEKSLIDCARTPLKRTPIALNDCENEPKDVKDKRDEIRRLLKKLEDKVGGSPVPFYAMLLMDGDNMGKLISKHSEEQNNISKALSIFTKEVKAIVGVHDGVTIYAGGDDVLAMLPMSNAFDCAYSLSKRYERSFQEAIPEAKATISAGLVFSHYHIPLRSVMTEAHYILDDIAKDQNGRNSIAVSVLKTSGKYCQWTVTWDRLSDKNGILRIDDLVSKVQEGPHKQFSKSFFYGMRDDLAIISGDTLSKPGSYAKLVDGLDPARFLTAEYMKSREQRVTREVAEMRVNSLLELSYKARNLATIDPMFISPDAAMLIKFLSQNSDGGSE